VTPDELDQVATATLGVNVGFATIEDEQQRWGLKWLTVGSDAPGGPGGVPAVLSDLGPDC
jgi:hypothetical protein